MAKKTESWEANDGTLHKTECAAAKRDVELLVESSRVQEKKPLVEWLLAHANTIATALADYQEACAPVAAATISKESDTAPGPGGPALGTQGDPCAHAPYCQSRHNDQLPCDCGASEREGCKDRGQGLQP